VKLRGRAEAPALGAEGAQFLSARGAKPQAHHGPLQRLLEAMLRLSDITAFQGALSSLGLEGRPYLPGLFRRAIEP
jgi:hypothetical protein